ncbi:hypothetical protein ACQ4LE_001574 [Meloidogyne hapla]
MFNSFKSILFLPFLTMQAVQAQQVNLGSLSLTRSPFTGDLSFGLGQEANIFGFGVDRKLGFNIGPGRFGAINDNGLILGNRRFGVDSQLGYGNGHGLDFGSFLNLFQPIGQFAQSFQQNPIANQGRNKVVNEELVNHDLNSSSAINVDEQHFPPSIGSGWNGEEEPAGKLIHENHFKEKIKDDLTMPLLPLDELKGYTTTRRGQLGAVQLGADN